MKGQVLDLFRCRVFPEKGDGNSLSCGGSPVEGIYGWCD